MIPSKRVFDLLIILMSAPLVVPVVAICALLIKLGDRGPAFFWSVRLGRDGREFSMPKLRSMRCETPVVETRAMDRLGAVNFLTPIGIWLRRYSLDELPQVWSVLRGDMSVVGYRPALPSQIYLNKRRETFGVHVFCPGITGLAQVKGRDLLTDEKKIELDLEYVKNWSLALDLRILIQTMCIVVTGKGTYH